MARFIIYFFFILSGNCFAEQYLLNVSYDPTRNLFKEINDKFIEYKNIPLIIRQSHGGSGKQTMAVMHGLPADVVTLAISSDIDKLVSKNMVEQNWRNDFPNNSSPYHSTIIFLVRKNNPKNIKDWSDLIRKDVVVITANPKTSGGAVWGYFAAWGVEYIKTKSSVKANQFISSLYKNVPVLDTSARGSMMTFVRRQIGDVMISWENEAYLAIKEFGEDKFEIIEPSMSIDIDLPVAIITQNAIINNNLDIAKEYVEFLYSDISQEIMAHNYYRPVNPIIFKKYKDQFAKSILFKFSDIGDIDKMRKEHLGTGGVFDKIYTDYKAL